ncbi:hypothetical protein DPMN_018561 [Dreissena polymorpha]|uniref:Uncharacterized protein n=1 Tax=Dreissena polymorpha TaxID=45954 RepID=A0A9D4S6H3_DREPO|nr:hypothetical protein DPMN_018561 [Dreissena polymorpha]
MLLEQHIAAQAEILLLEQHLNAARPENCCSSSNMLLEQHLNAARAAFVSARAEVKLSIRHWTCTDIGGSDCGLNMPGIVVKSSITSRKVAKSGQRPLPGRLNFEIRKVEIVQKNREAENYNGRGMVRGLGLGVGLGLGLG